MADLRSIAGHSFDLRGICQGEGCQVSTRKLSEILSATKENVGQHGWAHYGILNEKEQGKIEAERDRIWQAHIA